MKVTTIIYQAELIVKVLEQDGMPDDDAARLGIEIEMEINKAIGLVNSIYGKAGGIAHVKTFKVIEEGREHGVRNIK
ncbi:MAG: hypothetical protein ABID54_07985 [Pseudomonadota bacterium]